MRQTIVVVLVCASALAAADASDLARTFADATAGFSADRDISDDPPPRFAFTDEAFAIDSSGAAHLGTYGSPSASIIGKAADGSRWIAADIDYVVPCGMAGCEKMQAPQVHASGLFDPSGRAVAWHVGLVFAGSDGVHPYRAPKPSAPQKLATRIDAGGEDAAKLFAASIGDPKKLAATISDRKDAVLFGSERPERFVGGAAIRGKLVAWNLGFTVRDGIQAGAVPSKTVAWVAANVDAAKPGAKPTPYRVLAIYEKTGAAWKLVVLHFSSAFAHDE